MSSVIVCLGYSGSIIGIIQGLSWSILALCAILIRFEAWIPEVSTKTESGLLSLTILHAYIKEVDSKYVPDDVIITGDVLLYWAFAYLILSTTWSILSMWMLYVFLRKKKTLRKTILPIWAGCTCLISLLDLILTILLGIDYNTLVGKANPNFYAILATGILMTIAARGFVLWLLNKTIAVALIVLQCQTKDEISDILRHHINAYENKRLTIQGKKNDGFEWDYDKPNESSNSLNTYYGQSHRQAGNPQRGIVDEPIAKIGKPRGRNTPTKVPIPQPPNSFLHPRVPSPDYSPVLERRNNGQTKSALKTRTNNLYGTQF